MNHKDDIDRIEADIARTRAEMDQTLSELQGRFTPGQFLDQGLAYMKQSGGHEFVSNFGATVKYNPMPVALAGIGIAWLMASGHRSPPPAGMSAEHVGSHAGDGVRGMLQRAGDAASSVKATMSGAAQSSRDSLADAGASARARAAQLGQGLRSGTDSARRGLRAMLEEQPLLVGAMGLALGAALAAALPRTRAEDRLMGEPSDRLADEALRAGEAQLQKTGQAAQDMLGSGEPANRQTGGTDAANLAAQRPARGDEEDAARTRMGGGSDWQERTASASQFAGDRSAGMERL